MAIPTNPTGIRVQSLQTDNSFKVTWNSVTASPTVTQYNVYRSETSYTGFNVLATVTVAILQYIDNDIPFSFDKFWYYKISSTNSDGESPVAAAQACTDFDYFAFATTPVDLDYRSGLVTWVENETPSGTIDGSSNLFYTSYNYKPNTLQVYVSGAKLLATEFTQVTPNSFSLSVTPTISGSLSTNYIKI